MYAPRYLIGIEFCSVFSKKHSDAPKTGKPYKGINDPTDHSILAAENPADQIKLENSYKTPINGSNNRKDQCQRIHIDFLLCFVLLAIFFPDRLEIYVEIYMISRYNQIRRDVFE